MATKLTDNKRKNQAMNVLERSKRVSSTKKMSKNEVALRDQYMIIREDVRKLRDDIAKGYDMAKHWMEDKSSLLRSK